MPVSDLRFLAIDSSTDTLSVALGSGAPYYETRVTLRPLPPGAALGQPVDRGPSGN